MTEHNAQEEPRHMQKRLLIGGLTPCTPASRPERYGEEVGGEEEVHEERPGVHGVSSASWPCLCVVFVTNTTHKKSHNWIAGTMTTKLPKPIHNYLSRAHPPFSERYRKRRGGRRRPEEVHGVSGTS